MTALLCPVNRIGQSTQNRNARFLQALCEPQCRLPTQLHEHTSKISRLALLVDDFQHVLQCQRFEIQPIRGVIVGGDGFWVAVDHDGFHSGIPQCERGVDTGIVEFNSLTDSVGPRPQNHDFVAVTGNHLGFEVVARIVIRGVGGELPGTGVDRLEHGANRKRPTKRSNL